MVNAALKFIKSRRVIVVIVFVLPLFLVNPIFALADASISLFPGSGSLKVGDEIKMEVKIDAAGIPINAAEAVIRFPPGNFEVTSISKRDSIFSLWAKEPVFSNTLGQISFIGGIPHPGFTKEGGIIAVIFKAKKEGESSITFDEGKVLADDGKGTDVLAFFNEAKYFIQKSDSTNSEESEISLFSPTHPQQSQWYNNNNPSFQWELDPDVSGVSFVFDQKPDTAPDTRSEGLVESKDYSNVADGIWYFHIRLENGHGWGKTTSYRVQIDTHSPDLFDIAVDNAGDSTNPKPNLYFETNDKTSGVSQYKLKIGDAEFIDLLLAEVNPFTLPAQIPGEKKILVRAIDQAGNITQANAVIDVEAIASPKIIIWPETFISGDETLYIEGESLPQAEVNVYLNKGGEIYKEWSVLSNDKGEWSLSSEDLIESGNYSLTAGVKDKRGAESQLSDPKIIKVSFNGFAVGSLMITFKMLTETLFILIALGIILLGEMFLRTKRFKKTIKKEAGEARESLSQSFDILEKEIEKKIEMLDNQPGLNEEERKLFNDLKKATQTAKESIGKEIKDVEEKLK